MTLIEKLFRRFGYSKSHLENFPLAFGVGLSNDLFLSFGEKKAYAARAMQLFNSWTYACVRAIAEAIASTELRLFRILPSGDQEEIFEHEILDLLNGVNSIMTGYELRYIIASHLELAGNAYLLLDGVESENDKPTAIYPLNPRYVAPKRGGIPNLITGYEARIGTETRNLEPYQILHLKYPDPNDPYEGIGTVQAILQWILADNYASELNLKYFKNGARLTGLLESDTARTKEQLEYLRKSFAQIFSGTDNAYQIAALPSGTKYNPLSDNPKDMDFYNLQQVMRDKILAGFRVPKTILGTAESETNRATAETANYVFAVRTIKPKMQLIVSYLNEFLVPRFGDDLFLDFVDPAPENRELKIAEYRAALANKPYKSVNEVREEEGLPLITGGDSVMTDFSSVPLGSPQKKAAKPRLKGRPTKRKTRYARSAEKRKEIAKTIAENVAKTLAETQAKLKEITETRIKNITSLTDAEYEAVWKAFVTRVTPYEKRLTDSIRDFNKKQEAEIVKNLPRILKSQKAIDPDLLFDEEEWVGIMIDLATPILTDLYKKEGKEAAALLGIEDIDILTPEVRRAIDRSIELMATEYGRTTRQALKETLTDAIEEGAGLHKLTDLVSEIRAWSDDVRAERVARTEAYRTANDATREAWKQSGVVKELKWYTAADERVCEFCAPLNGKIVSIEKNFFDKGDIVAGSEGGKLSVDYAPISGGALHPNCRCYIRPEIITTNE